MTSPIDIDARWRWLTAVFAADPRPTMAELGLAIVLARHANSKTGAAWPAQRTVERLLRLDRRNVRRGISGLLAKGMIAPAQVARRSNAYQLVVPVGLQGAPTEGAPAPPLRGSSSPLSGRSTAPSVGALEPPEHAGNPSDQRGTRSVLRAAPATRPERPLARGAVSQYKSPLA